MKRFLATTLLIFLCRLPAKAQTHFVTVKWDASTSSGVGYHVYRAPSSTGPFTVIASVSTLQNTDQGVISGITYFYEVTSFTNATESIPSSIVSATVPGSPPPPPPPTTVPYLLETSSTSLSFSGTAGGVSPAIQSLSVQDSTPCPPPSGTPVCHWPFTAQNSQSWLLVSPAVGTTSATLQISVKLTGLVAGTYKDSITLTVVPQAGVVLKNSPFTIPVTLTVTGITPPPPKLTLTCVNNVCTIGGGTSGQTGTIQIVPNGPTATWKKP